MCHILSLIFPIGCVHFRLPLFLISFGRGTSEYHRLTGCLSTDDDNCVLAGKTVLSLLPLGISSEDISLMLTRILTTYKQILNIRLRSQGSAQVHAALELSLALDACPSPTSGTPQALSVIDYSTRLVSGSGSVGE